MINVRMTNPIKKINGIIICFLIIVPMIISISFFSFSVYADDYINKGIDVSDFQGDINFVSVKDSGIQIVYIRAGEGDNFVDTQFNANSEKAKNAGLDFGFYYYVTAANEEQAISQAKTFANLIKDKQYTARPAMDFELFDNLSKEQINAIGLTFMETLEQETSITPMIYTDAYNAANLWNSIFKKFPVWIADYSSGSRPPADSIWPTWDGYQYSDNGTVSGIETRVDLDDFKSSVLIDRTELIRGSLEVSLVNKSQDNLTGGVFEIKDSVGNVIKQITATNGEATLNNIKFGKYTCTQIKAPDGYALDKNPQSFEIITQNEIVKLTFVNSKEKNPHTGLDTYNNNSVTPINNLYQNLIAFAAIILLAIVTLIVVKQIKNEK